MTRVNIRIKDQCRLDIRKYSFFTYDKNYFVNASSVNMFKNKVDIYLRRADYT